MSTLQELIRYCSKDQHLGALLLTGEWGCGKTYLIETELAEALRDTHFIVRVSLFGVSSIDAMQDAVRRQWLLTCTPFLGRLHQGKDSQAKNNKFITAFNSILKIFNPVAGNVASAIVTVDPLEYIPLEPVVDDYLSSGGKKRVVLVFDDLIHSKLDWVDIVGCINEYCENKGFKTILIANEEVINASERKDDVAFRRMTEKTIIRKVLYIPDYQEIIHGLISRGSWPSQEYAAFLTENEKMIFDIFALDPPQQCLRRLLQLPDGAAHTLA